MSQKKHPRVFGKNCIQETTNNVIIRFKSENLTRVHLYSMEDAKRDYAEIISGLGKVKRSTSR